MARSPAQQLAKLKKANALLDMRIQIANEREKLATKRLNFAMGKGRGGRRRR